MESFFFLSTDCMCVIGRNGMFKKINPTFLKLLEYEEEELVDTLFVDCLHPDDRERTLHCFQEYLQGNFNSCYVNRYLTKSGDVRWLEWKAVSLDKGNIYGIAHDITGSKDIEKSFADLNLKLSYILNLVPHPIFIKDKDGKYILANEAQANIFSLTVNEILGKTDAELIKDPVEYQAVLETDKFVVEQQREVVLKEQIITHDNSEYHILNTTKRPFISPLDDDIKILGVSIDMTEMKNAEKELLKANFELDNFVYKSSHDLRAPLRSILGLLDLIQRDKDPYMVDLSVQHAKKSLKTLDTFIADLTNYSRNSRLELRKERINFISIIDDCLGQLSYMENAHKVKLIKNISPDLEFYSDPIRLKILFMNLISNAIKYQNSHSGCSPYLIISVEKVSSECYISIIDNGIGIEEQYSDKVFDMFFRASEMSFGSGLGLYIVKQIIEKLKGEIKIFSKLFEGTELNIKLHDMEN